jgi:hypothetical protein
MVVPHELGSGIDRVGYESDNRMKNRVAWALVVGLAVVVLGAIALLGVQLKPYSGRQSL